MTDTNSERVLAYIEKKLDRRIEDGSRAIAISDITAMTQLKSKSAWLLFSAENRSKMIKTYPDEKSGAITRRLSQEWAALKGSDTRKNYETKAQELREQKMSVLREVSMENPSQTKDQLDCIKSVADEVLNELIGADPLSETESDESGSHCGDKRNSMCFDSFRELVLESLRNKSSNISSQRSEKIAIQLWELLPEEDIQKILEDPSKLMV